MLVKIKDLLLVSALLVATSSLGFAKGESISTSEAGNYIGQNATVCGEVASTKFAERTKGQPTFLNLDAPYPHQKFTVVIWGNKREAFGSPEIAYKGKAICATGLVENYKGTPEIIAEEPSQITVSQ